MSFNMLKIHRQISIKNYQKYLFFFKVGLTGTPLMNNIKDVFTLVQFLNP